MPNLTSYHAPPIHLNRELPKTYCDLIRHEIDYNHFLHTRIPNIQSPLSLTNKNHIQQHKYSSPNQQSSDVYQHNLHLCKKILQIWTNNGKQNRGVDCHNENYKKQINISHFRLRQKRWKEKVESENKRFIHSLIYHRKKYRPLHDRYVAQEAYEQHLKLLKMMSQYPKYVLTNTIYKNLFNHYLPERIYYNYTQFYNRDMNIPVQAQCQTLPVSYKFNKQKPQTIKVQSNKSIKQKGVKPNKYSRTPPTYIQNVLQQAINDAIHIYNQPLPSAPNRIKSSYSENGQWSKRRLHHQQELFRSTSCRQLLESSHKTKQQKGSLENSTSTDKMIDGNSRFSDSSYQVHKQKQIEVNQQFSNSSIKQQMSE